MMAVEDNLHRFLPIYLAMPQRLRTIAGSLFRKLPNQIRYGKRYVQFLMEAEAIENEITARIACHKMYVSLTNAVRHVPAYQEYFPINTNFKNDEYILEHLRRLPLINKSTLKSSLSSYLATNHSPTDRLETFTGGSTAEPMRFYLHKHVTRTRETAYVSRLRNILGITKNQPELTLSLRGRNIGRNNRGDDSSIWMYEPLGNQLMLSTDHLNTEYLPIYSQILNKYQPTFIHAFPSALFALCNLLAHKAQSAFAEQVKGILLTSENNHSFQLDSFVRTFPHAKIIQHYGHSERVVFATCNAIDEPFNCWPLYGYVELLDSNGQPVTRPGEVGEIVGTSFDNQVMPFIRYRTGDLAILNSPPSQPGLPPKLEKIEGRLQEFIICRDRRLISITSIGAAHLSSLATATEIQYEQYEAGLIKINLVTNQALSPAQRESIQNAIRNKTQGGCDVFINEVKSIPSTHRGKKQLLIQHIPIQNWRHHE